MMKIFHAVLLLSIGCSVHPEAQPALRIWVEDDPTLSRQLMLQGCEVWKAEGVDCRLVDRLSSANVFVEAENVPCTKEADGTVTLAYASYSGSKIVMRSNCIGSDKHADMAVGHQSDDPFFAKYRAIAAHELGHMLGMGRHIPVACDGTEAYHRVGFGICGPALMNPAASAIAVLTVFDHLEYETMMEHYGAQPGGGIVFFKECRLSDTQP